MWLGLNADGALPEVGQQVPAYACYGTGRICCGIGYKPVIILNCLGYVVYHLSPTEVGHYERYCATTEN